MTKKLNKEMKKSFFIKRKLLKITIKSRRDIIIVDIMIIYFLRFFDDFDGRNSYKLIYCIFRVNKFPSPFSVLSFFHSLEFLLKHLQRNSSSGMK